ncbi:MAG TPA: LCP family protein [Clostridiales bacterium]|nr:LCP family protein [Clostridiales bacterium]
MENKENSEFSFENDPEFNQNFYNNIEKVLSDADIYVENPEMDNTVELELASEQVEEDFEQTRDVLSESGLADELATALESQDDEIQDDEIMEEMSQDNPHNEDEIDEELIDIHASLAKQVCSEIEKTSENLEEKKKKKIPRWLIIQSSVFGALLLIVLFLGFTPPGHSILKKMGLKIGGGIWDVWTGEFDEVIEPVDDTDFLEEDDLVSDSEEIDENTIVWPDHPGEGRREEGVYNILLLGEEAIDSGSARGRTDLIIIATLNTNQKAIKLTSLMRDTLVQIPGFKDNKLNSAYEKGGVDLLYETIALNFDIRLDGCALVNFENFEKIIDRLGGLEITLTAAEAKYLNNTNYISKPQHRNVVEGTQILNGNQVLGYSRIRKRATITGNNNDYGRTDRHRIILNAIFEKYKTESKVELLSTMLSVLPMIKTDIESRTFEQLLDTFIAMGTMEIEQLRIPIDGAFADNVSVRGMDVLVPYWDENMEALHEFIFGSETESADTSANNTSNDPTVAQDTVAAQ